MGGDVKPSRKQLQARIDALEFQLARRDFIADVITVKMRRHLRGVEIGGHCVVPRRTYQRHENMLTAGATEQLDSNIDREMEAAGYFLQDETDEIESVRSIWPWFVRVGFFTGLLVWPVATAGGAW